MIYEYKDRSGCLGLIIGFIICAIITLCVSSCRTIKEHEISIDSTLVSKTELSALKDSLSSYRSQYQSLVQSSNKKDSVYNYHKDSTFVFVKGDSTIIERWHENVIYKESASDKTYEYILIDSLNAFQGKFDSYMQRLDSIQKSSKDVKTVEQIAYIPNWMKGLCSISFAILLVFIAIIIYKIKRGFS